MTWQLPLVGEAMMDAYTEQEQLLHDGLLDPDQPTLYAHMVEKETEMRNMTTRAIAIRAVLKAVDDDPMPPWFNARALDTMLTNKDGEPRLSVARIVEIVLDVVAETIQDRQGMPK